MPPEKKEAKERKLTKYQVFVLIKDTGWKPIGRVDAANGVAAITAKAEAPGEYRAVPVSNITSQAMGFPPPPPQKLVAIDQLELTEPTALHDAIAPPADPEHSAAGGSLRAVETEDDGA